MPPSNNNRQRHPVAVAAFVITILSFPHNSISFPTSHILQPLSRSSSLHSITSPPRSSRPLHMAVQSPMRPMEEERDHEEKSKQEKKNKNHPNREWKQVVGGFVPKFLQRNTDNHKQHPKDETLPIQTIDTLPDYKHHVVDETNQLVIVRFYAPWCKSCKASEPLFRKLVREYSPSVKFVEVPLTKETAYLHEGLGVPSVPYAHVYHPQGGLVEERKINKKVFGEFREVVECYVRGSCDLDWEDEEDEEEFVVLQEDGFQ
ncbi:hypothetical protein HJC23_010454 [Cyclotella cryptica]|uniref:Thioredoxin domain-containing protein n=1 Tax=Cyclotella cryptica TaxID=29204 RepID=A0ABD3QI35_9STRA|eukprot:CCRYP_005356-RA/>CCRYP_005356-RA protein AED:0.07 eAED:0.07 QI:241/-1/1/1/-1/1/1/279/259